MPPAQARRLNDLIDRSKACKLPRADERELRDLLELVNRETFWRLARAVSIQNGRELRRIREPTAPLKRRVKAG